MKAAEARVAAAEAQGVQWKNVRGLALCSDGGGAEMGSILSFSVAPDP